jgi:hypothetical protein
MTMAKFTPVETAANREREMKPSEVEFRADLEPHMDPVAALGYQPGKARPVFTEIIEGNYELAGAYTPPQGRFREGDDLPASDAIAQSASRDNKTIKIGDVVVGKDFIDDNSIWAHEFRHRGLNNLRTRQTREAFSESYGEEAAQFLYDSDDEEGYVTYLTDYGGTGIPENVAEHDETMKERGPKLMGILNDAALAALDEDSKTPPDERKEAVSWLRRILGGP